MWTGGCIEGDVAASFGELRFEEDVASYGDGEAGADFEGEIGEECAFGGGAGGDGGEERSKEGDAGRGRGGCWGLGKGKWGGRVGREG